MFIWKIQEWVLSGVTLGVPKDSRNTIEKGGQKMRNISYSQLLFDFERSQILARSPAGRLKGKKELKNKAESFRGSKNTEPKVVASEARPALIAIRRTQERRIVAPRSTAGHAV